MAGTSLPPSLLSQGPSLLFSSSNQVSEAKCRIVIASGKRSLVRCLAKKKISFTDQILDYIEGGPKLRKWYGASELLPKDGSSSGDDNEVVGMRKKCNKLPKRVELESQDLLHFSCFHLSTSFGTYEAKEEDDDRDGDKDAVFVTDGDSDLGQVCNKACPTLEFKVLESLNQYTSTFCAQQFFFLTRASNNSVWATYRICYNCF